ncbi:MAG: CPBP family intramembrane metalloprotease [Candidatus Eremiobacteraeota bacterium]|nr:CPBP family intramembrane metalloprotease [Candidatus Eremiobacteraeota bacterium]
MLAIVFAALIAGIGLAVAVVALMNPRFLENHHIDTLSAVVAQGAIDIPVIVALLLTVPRASGFSFRELGFVRLDLRAIAIAVVGVGAAILLVSATSSIVDALRHGAKHPQQIAELFVALKGPYRIGTFIFFAAVIAPIAEELVFRVFVFNVGLRYAGFWIGAIVSAALFGLAHGDLANALPLASVGLVLCGVYYLTRNAYASMITHGCFNLVTLIALLAFPKIAGG